MTNRPVGRYKLSVEFERFWRSWHPHKHRPRPKPARTYDGCEHGRGWHLWDLTKVAVAEGENRSTVVCSWCGFNALQVSIQRDRDRAILAVGGVLKSAERSSEAAAA